MQSHASYFVIFIKEGSRKSQLCHSEQQYVQIKRKQLLKRLTTADYLTTLGNH